MPISNRESEYLLLVLEEIYLVLQCQLIVIVDLVARIKTRKRKRNENETRYSMIERMPAQIGHLNRITGVSDIDCISNLRMDRNTFGRLCQVLRQLGGLSDGRHVSVEEQVAMFVSVLAHHKKNRVIGFDFWRSGQTVSRYVHVVLTALLRLHTLLFVKPEAVSENSTDARWKWFEGCLGALDGTYVSVMVPNADKPRYRMRKGLISSNTLAVCDRNLKFSYIFPGWEGSVADSRILRNAINRLHGLKVPKGNYYLCENGYANSEGFLVPYKGVRYHLKEWGPTSARPQNAEELFNMRHTKARNCIERAFGILKMRWGILRSNTFYFVKIQNRLIIACFLLNNFIRSEMVNDPIEQMFDNLVANDAEADAGHDHCIDTVEVSNEWNAKRDAIAQAMWQSFYLGA